MMRVIYEERSRERERERDTPRYEQIGEIRNLMGYDSES